MEKSQNQVKEFISVYFIENHILISPVTIRFSKNLPQVGELEKVEQKLYEYNNNFIYTIYRFKINISKLESTKKKEKKKMEIKIKLEDKEDNIFESKIYIDKFNKDIFIYNFKFEKSTMWTQMIEPPLSLKFSNIQQFEIYIEYIRKKLKLKQNADENIDLIYSTQELLIGSPDKKYSFSFFLLILLECFTTKCVQSLLSCFKPEKIEEIGKIPDKQLKRIKNVLNTFEKNPEKVLDNVKEKQKDDYGMKLFMVLLFFNNNFNKERIQEFLNNENENIRNYIYQGLLNKKYLGFFNNLKLTKEQINNIINRVKDFEQLNTGLKFSSNLLELLQIISINFKKCCDLCQKELNNNKKPLIDVESLIELQKEDTVEELCTLYKDLIERQKKFNYIFLAFKTTLCEKYIEHFEGIDIYKLFAVKEIVDYMKSKKNLKLKILI